MTNGEQADRLMEEAEGIAGDMRRALDRGRWNLAARRAQEIVELVVKGLLGEMGIDYPRTHDPAPLLAETIRRSGTPVEESVLGWLCELSSHLAEIRAPAFYHEVEIPEAEARVAVDGAERVVGWGRGLLARLRAPGGGV